MIRGNQLVHSVVWLATMDSLLSIMGMWRKLIWPVHPVHSGIDVMLVTGSNLKDSRNPVVIRFLARSQLLLVRDCLLALDGGFVRDVNESFAEVLDTVD